MLLKCFSTFQILLCLMRSDVFFFLHPVEEGEGEIRERCCTPGVQEYVYRGVLVLTMSSSCDICSCWSTRLVSDRIRKDDE